MTMTDLVVDKKTTHISCPLVAIVGPTASGKSSLAMKIALKYNGEIICADSRTVYRGMDVGTAKPTDEDQKLVRHHVLDLIDPDQGFSAARFKELAERSIDDIAQRGKLPIMVGGTGLYVDSVLFNYEFGKIPSPEERQLLAMKSTEDLQAILAHKKLKLPENSKNRRHLIRAIESNGVVEQKRCIRNNTVVVGIATERDVLRTRIRSRIEQMFAAGVLDEAKKIAQKYGWDSEAMKGDIYRSCRRIIVDKEDISAAIDDCVKRDMSLAKRQMTWFKRNKQIVWSDDLEYLERKIDRFIELQGIKCNQN